MASEIQEKEAWKTLYGEGGLVNRDGKMTSILNSYELVANKYDSTLKTLQYNAPAVLADCIIANVGQGTKELKVLDVGAGTGLVGKMLRERGFKGQMDAVDASSAMLAKAEDTGLYNKLICKVLTPENPLQISAEYYDVIVSAGTFLQNYVKPEVIYDLMPGLKTGGILVIALRINDLVSNSPYVASFDATLETLYKQEKAKLVSCDKFKNYDVSFDEQGKCDGFKALAYCLQKI